MDILKLENHIKNHPKDYQSVIALYKARSDLIEKELKEKRIEKLKKIEKARKEYAKHTK